MHRSKYGFCIWTTASAAAARHVQVRGMGAACRMYPLHLDVGTARCWACQPSRLYPAGPGVDATWRSDDEIVRAVRRSASTPPLLVHVPPACPRREPCFPRRARKALRDFSPPTRTHWHQHCIIRTHHSCAPSCYILPHTEHNLPSPRSFRSRVPINTQLINPFRNIS